MESEFMVLRIVLLLEVLFEQEDITKLVVDTSKGSVGLLPLRLDCIALIVPGIVVYEVKGGREGYIAVDRGVLVKTGRMVTLAVRDGIVSDDLGKLREIIQTTFLKRSEEEREVQQMVTKLESVLIQRSTVRF